MQSEGVYYFPVNVYWTHPHNNQRQIQATRSDQETSPTNPQQQHYRIPNVIILATEHDKQDLAILEALLIKQHGPKINRQTEYFNNTLKNSNSNFATLLTL